MTVDAIYRLLLLLTIRYEAFCLGAGVRHVLYIWAVIRRNKEKRAPSAIINLARGAVSSRPACQKKK